MNLPADIANQALDAIGYDEESIGDLEEGTRAAQVCLRAYGQCLRQLLRGAHWDFARKQAPLQLLADATGNTANVGTIVPTPWTYEYAYPVDCMKARFIPWNRQQQTNQIPGNISIPTTPLMTGLGAPTIGQKQRPARFLIGTDGNYPPDPGGIYWETQGVSPTSRTVIMCNVPQATLVYTALMLYPSTWDSMFRAAMVAYLASEIALALTKDKKFGLTLRSQQIATVKQKLQEARLVDGNEGSFSSDISVDWLQFRNSGGAWWGAGRGDGNFANGWDSCAFSDGSAY